MLILLLTEQLKTKHISKIITYADDRALGFYFKNGFFIEGEIESTI